MCILSIVSFICFYLDYRNYRKHKTWAIVINPIIIIVSVTTLFLTIDHLEVQDRTPTVFYATDKDSLLGSFSIDFRENGTYKFHKNTAFFEHYYSRGQYTIKDSIICLDKSNLNQDIISERLLMKTIPRNTIKKQGVIGQLLGLPKPGNAPQTFLFQLNEKGDTISNATILLVNKDVLRVRQ